MSEDELRRRRSLTVRPARSDYAVGYGKPPAEGRFKPGRSGNPNGRPRGCKNHRTTPSLYEERLKYIILNEAYRSISINDVNGPMTIPMAQAIVRSLAVNAAKGQQRAQRLFTELLGATERDRKRLHDDWLQTAINYKVEWERELERRQRLGIAGPEPLPHPDHVVVDLQAGTATIRGPATKEEKAEWDFLLSQGPLIESELKRLEALRADPQCKNEKTITAEIERIRTTLAIIADH